MAAYQPQPVPPPAPVAAYQPQPAPPRPPGQPERPWWRTGRGWGAAAGWVLVAAVFGFGGSFLYKWSGAVDQGAKEEAELARERDHTMVVDAWLGDSSASAPPPDSSPVPTSTRAKRLWVANRLIVDRALWGRAVMRRHGITGYKQPAVWTSAAFQANARNYPDVAAFVNGRAAALAELEKASDAWMAERTAALARQSGLPAEEIRALMPGDFARHLPEELRLMEAMQQLHRHLVRVDPRVRHAGGNQLLFERDDDARRFQELVLNLDRANALTAQAQERRRYSQAATLRRLMYPDTGGRPAGRAKTAVLSPSTAMVFGRGGGRTTRFVRRSGSSSRAGAGWWT